MPLPALSTKQKATIGAVVLAAAAGLFAMVRWQRERDFRPLFTSLASEDAGAVVQKLKESGTEYRLSEDSRTLLVPSARVPELRLTMAAAGLPRSGRMGFELFDKINLGASEFAEQINYHRALEGELERSIGSLVEVEQARVHLTFPRDSVYLEARQPAKASVVLKLRPGARLAQGNILAVCHLVSSAVEGLAPEAVSVLDMRGNLLNRARTAAGVDGAVAPDASLDYRRRVEADLLAKIGATLEPLLGADRFRAGVSVECDFSSGEQSEEIYDPTRSVMVTSQKTEDGSSLSGSTGVPGTASTLPRPTSRPASSSSGMRRQTENITFQSSRTVKRVRMPQGTVTKMSVSVLVDQAVHWEGKPPRRVLVPPPPEKLKTIREVVAAATGLTPQRGDQLIVETLPFDATERSEPPELPAQPKSAPAARPKWDPRLMIGAGAGAVVLLLLLAGMAMMVLRKRRRQTAASANSPAAITGPAAAPAATPGTALSDQMDRQLSERETLKHQLETDALSALKLAPAVTKKAEVLTKHVRENIKKDPDVPLHILRSWLREDEN